MKITSLNVSNFKSFEKLNVNLGEYTLVVGANASGKSNFISIFRFISDIPKRGIDDAISLQGGIDYLVNAKIGKQYPINVSFEIDTSDQEWIRILRKTLFAIRVMSVQCSFEVTPNKRGTGYSISSDELSVLYKVFRNNAKSKRADRFQETDALYKATILRKSSRRSYNTIFQRIKGENIIENSDSFLDLLGFNFFKDLYQKSPSKGKELLLNRADFLLPPGFFESLIRIYDFDPKRLKKPCSMTSVKMLDEDGSNIASVLKRIISSQKSRKELAQLLQNALPFIQTINVDNNPDQSFSYKVKESFATKEYHSVFLSDGTASIIAIIVALYFEKESQIIILEEPERNVHPKLLQCILEMVKDVSNNKQIIMTTHNQEIVKYSDLSNIQLIMRDENGYSKMSCPSNSTSVQCFMKNELGIDELFTQNLLG